MYKSLSSYPKRIIFWVGVFSVTMICVLLFYLFIYFAECCRLLPLPFDQSEKTIFRISTLFPINDDKKAENYYTLEQVSPLSQKNPIYQSQMIIMYAPVNLTLYIGRTVHVNMKNVWGDGAPQQCINPSIGGKWCRAISSPRTSIFSTIGNIGDQELYIDSIELVK